MELKPTIFPAVPRVLNKVYDRVNDQLESKPALLKVFDGNFSWQTLLTDLIHSQLVTCSGNFNVVDRLLLSNSTLLVCQCNGAIIAVFAGLYLLKKVFRSVTLWLELQRIFNYAVKSKLADVENGVIRKNTIWDTLFFGKIQEKLGGRVKVSYIPSLSGWWLKLNNVHWGKDVFSKSQSWSDKSFKNWLLIPERSFMIYLTIRS